MKVKLFSLTALLFSFGAHAAPDCWTTDGAEQGPNKDGIVVMDGSFVLTADSTTMSKESLLQLIDRVDYGNLKADGFPTLLDNMMVFSLKAHAGDAGEEVNRSLLIEKVGAQLDELASIEGVESIECNSMDPGSPLLR